MKRLKRSSTEKKLLGVCGGIAEYLCIDPTTVRALFVFFSIIYGGGFCVYMLLAILMREEPCSEKNN